MKGLCTTSFLTIAALAVLGGCQSGSAGMGSDETPTLGGIEGSGVRITSSGSVTALGSIVVNDVRYDVDSAAVTINGAPASAFDLVPGQVTIVEGTLDSGRTAGKATRVSIEIAVAGPVSAVDVTNGRITILGQAIEIPPSAIVPDISPGSPLGGIQVGRELEVSGFADSTGVLHATRIDLRRVATPLLLSGYVTGLDPAARTFLVNGQIVDYSVAALVGIAFPAEGDMVRVLVDFVQHGAAVAKRIDRLDGRLPGARGDSADLQGWVTRIQSDSEFDVNGYRVVSENGLAGSNGGIVQIDSFVTVKGSLIADGVVQAADVLTVPPGRVSGRVNIAGVTYALSGVLAQPGEFRLAIGQVTAGPPETKVGIGQLVGTFDFAHLGGSGNAVLIGENCNLPAPGQFCGRAQPVRLILDPVTVPPGGRIDADWTTAGKLRIETAAGEEFWPLRISYWGGVTGFEQSAFGYLHGLLDVSVAEFVHNSPVLMTVDAQNRLFFQSPETGCIGNGGITPHSNTSINLYRVTLRIEGCAAPHAHLNTELQGLSTLESWTPWAYDFGVLRIWVSTAEGAERPAALSFWAYYRD